MVLRSYPELPVFPESPRNLPPHYDISPPTAHLAILVSTLPVSADITGSRDVQRRFRHTSGELSEVVSPFQRCILGQSLVPTGLGDLLTLRNRAHDPSKLGLLQAVSR